MDKLERSKTSFIIFILIIIILLFGGSYLLKNINKEEVISEEKSIKLDENKDYFYNESNECLSVSIPICYPVIKINIDSNDARDVEEKLNNNMASLDKNYTKISDTDTTGLELLYNYDDIYFAKTINYISHVSTYVLSISVTSYDYYATGDYQNIKEESYNFDLKTGKLLDNEQVLKLYKLTYEDLITKINKDKEHNFTKLDNYNILIDENNIIIVNYVATENDIVYNDSITIYR